MLLDDYQTLRTAAPKDFQLPDLSAGRVTLRTETHDDGEAALSALRAYAPSSGWLQCASRLIEMTRGFITPDADDGMPLQGEWVIDDQQSIALRHLGAGRYLLTHWKEGEGTEVLVEVRSFLHRDHRWMRYRCFLEDRDDGHGTRVTSARLAQFPDDKMSVSAVKELK